MKFNTKKTVCRQLGGKSACPWLSGAENWLFHQFAFSEGQLLLVQGCLSSKGRVKALRMRCSACGAGLAQILPCDWPVGQWSSGGRFTAPRGLSLLTNCVLLMDCNPLGTVLSTPTPFPSWEFDLVLILQVPNILTLHLFLLVKAEP